MNKRFYFLNPHKDNVTATPAMHSAVEFYKGHLEPDLNCRGVDSVESVFWETCLKSKLRYSKVCYRINLGLVVATNHEQYDMQSVLNIALKIYLTLPVSNCTGERSFSHIPWKGLRTTCVLPCCNRGRLSLTNTEHKNELVQKIDFEQLV